MDNDMTFDPLARIFSQRQKAQSKAPRKAEPADSGSAFWNTPAFTLKHVLAICIALFVIFSLSLWALTKNSAQIT